MDPSFPPADPADARRDALDELLRPVPRRRPLFRRDATWNAGPAGTRPSVGGEPEGPDGTDGPADPSVPGPLVRPRRAAASIRRGLPVADLAARPPTWLIACVVAVVVAGGWWWLRRPVPAEDRLPRATAPVTTDAGVAPTTAGGADGGAPATGSSGTPGGAAAAPTTSGGPVTVHVAGAVLRPGVVTLAAGGRVVDAVQAAGGMAAGADPDRVNLAARVVDGERVVVPVVGQPVPAEVPATPPAGSGTTRSSGTGGPPGPSSAPAAPVDLNRATAEELDTLPGVGPSTAAAIVAHRESSGPFRSVDDLLDVRGIGDARLETLRPLVTVG
ncbi:MAG: helix-hairpin-helix domain-containing protein [Microthrixaceae bacterium]